MRQADGPGGSSNLRWARLVAAAVPVGALLGLLLPACGSSSPSAGGGAANQTASATTTLVTGRAVYADRCASCHGSTGQGVSGAKLAGVVGQRYPTVDDEIAIVADGTASRQMPAFKAILTPEELRAVVAYTRSL